MAFSGASALVLGAAVSVFDHDANALDKGSPGYLLFGSYYTPLSAMASFQISGQLLFFWSTNAFRRSTYYCEQHEISCTEVQCSSVHLRTGLSRLCPRSLGCLVYAWCKVKFL